MTLAGRIERGEENRREQEREVKRRRDGEDEVSGEGL
jgi:hypothetical protein